VSLTVQSPVSGVVVALSDVPDPVFSGKIVGPGVAITPDTADGGEVSALARRSIPTPTSSPTTTATASWSIWGWTP